MLYHQAILVQIQAGFLAPAIAKNQRIAKSQRRWAESERRIMEGFARIEARLSRIEGILLEQKRILQALPEAILEKISFKAAGQT